MSDTVTRVPSPDEWVTAVRAAFQDGFTFFDWLSAVDVTDDADAPEFDVVCHLLDVSTPGQLRECRLAVRIADGVALPSLTAIYPGAAWHERETHEMFGIAVSGFVDGTGLGLRPLLLPDAFEGTPLRKSFQLAAPGPEAKSPAMGMTRPSRPAVAASRRRACPHLSGVRASRLPRGERAGDGSARAVGGCGVVGGPACVGLEHDFADRGTRDQNGRVASGEAAHERGI